MLHIPVSPEKIDASRAGLGADQSSFAFDDLLEGARTRIRGGPRMVRSVAQDAGIGSFIYLEGSADRRYVFSRIDHRQAGLYRNAIFALAGASGTCVWTGDLNALKALADPGRFGQLYVHLLADGEEGRDCVLRDLGQADDSN